MSEPRIQRTRFIDLWFAALCLNLLGAQILHEAGHWLILTLTGRRPVWALTSLVQLSDRMPRDATGWSPLEHATGQTSWLYLASLPATNAEWAAFLAAGPLAQLLAVLAGLLLALRAPRAHTRTLGLMWALVNAFGHVFYQLVSGLQGGGSDEVLLGQYLGIQWWFITRVFGLVAWVGLVAGLALLSSARRRLIWLGAVFLGTLPAGPLFMLANGAIIDGVDFGNRLFTPLFGFALPVLILALVGAGGIALVSRRMARQQPAPG